MTTAPNERDQGPGPDGREHTAPPPSRGLPHDSHDLPAVTPDVDSGQIKHFVTQIKSAEHQIGEHILTSLQDPATVAVLTAVVVGPDGGQRIVSAALDPALLHEVQKLLKEAESERDEEIPCVGFHCLLRKKQDPDDSTS